MNDIPAIPKALGLLRGAVVAGEKWSDACESAVQAAHGEYKEMLARQLAHSVAAPSPTVTVESGHVSVEVTVNAKGDYQYSAKVVMPIVPTGNPDLDASNARVLASEQLEHAEAFLKAKYGRATNGVAS